MREALAHKASDFPHCISGRVCLMKTARNERRLCRKCREAYETADYEVEKVWTSYEKPCDICTRPAWLYLVNDKRGKA